MATYLMFGCYTVEGLKAISAERTDKAAALLKKYGGELKAGYAVLGEDDLVLVVELPGTEQAIKASIALTKLTGIAFTTAPAITCIRVRQASQRRLDRRQRSSSFAPMFHERPANGTYFLCPT